jgi:hypothetical protein
LDGPTLQLEQEETTSVGVSNGQALGSWFPEWNYFNLSRSRSERRLLAALWLIIFLLPPSNLICRLFVSVRPISVTAATINDYRPRDLLLVLSTLTRWWSAKEAI